MCVCFIVLLSGSHCLVSFYARVCRYIYTVMRACVCYACKRGEKLVEIINNGCQPTEWLRRFSSKLSIQLDMQISCWCAVIQFLTVLVKISVLSG